MYIIEIDKLQLQEVSNHPVHILNNEGSFSPSSFLPFCSFGQEIIGTKIDNFDVPVCDIFQPTNYLDQICYETDLENLKDSRKIRNQLEMGLTLIIDYNEERQNYKMIENEPNPMMALYQNNDQVSVYLDTISLCIYKYTNNT